MQSLTLTVLMPHRCLSPNSRAHWARKVKHRQAARLDATQALAASLGGRPPPRWALIRFDVLVRGPGPRMDDDNVTGILKATRDQLAQELGVNDRAFRIGEARFERVGHRRSKHHPIADPTTVTITLSERTEA